MKLDRVYNPKTFYAVYLFHKFGEIIRRRYMVSRTIQTHKFLIS